MKKLSLLAALGGLAAFSSSASAEEMSASKAELLYELQQGVAAYEACHNVSFSQAQFYQIEEQIRRHVPEYRPGPKLMVLNDAKNHINDILVTTRCDEAPVSQLLATFEAEILPGVTLD